MTHITILQPKHFEFRKIVPFKDKPYKQSGLDARTEWLHTALRRKRVTFHDHSVSDFYVKAVKTFAPKFEHPKEEWVLAVRKK